MLGFTSMTAAWIASGVLTFAPAAFGQTADTDKKQPTGPTRTSGSASGGSTQGTSTPRSAAPGTGAVTPNQIRLVDTRAATIHPGDPAGLRSVEAGVGDIGPLSTSPREMRIDLRQAGFERVFAIPGQNRPGAGPTNFVRFDSGLAAVFPRSEYRRTPWGPVAEIPAGTTFYIGKLPDSVLQAGATPGGTSSLLRVERGLDLSARASASAGSTLVKASTRVDMRAPAPGQAAPSEPQEARTILNDRGARDSFIDGLGKEDARKTKPPAREAPAGERSNK